MKINFLDCTLRDGGYYNNWDFDLNLINSYLEAMDDLKIDYVEIGFRSLINDGFKGGTAYSNDKFLKSLNIPHGLSDKIGVMVNGSEISNPKTQISCLKKLFDSKHNSHVSLVRIACHIKEFKKCLPASKWLKDNGYIVGFNLMQISEHSLSEITKLANEANKYPIDVLYFADSMGSVELSKLNKIVKAFKRGWEKDLGIHAHDNTGMAVNNCLEAVNLGVNWLDSTVTGMGRGPGNAQTEYLVLALERHRKKKGNYIKLLKIIDKYFKPMKDIFGWGTNPFYFLAGQNGIHPSYIQKMLQDKIYSEEDILATIEYLKYKIGNKFNIDALESARHFFSGKPQGKWEPKVLLKNKIVLVLGSGPGVKKYQKEIENFIIETRPQVIALNTQSNIRQDLINLRVACHPVRLLADCKNYISLPQPLITPFSMLPKNIKKYLTKKEILDYGVRISKQFKFKKNYCELPSSLVIAYALAIANSGEAKEIILAGFDGYELSDPRHKEMNQIFNEYSKIQKVLKILSITPTNYDISSKSIFGPKF